MEVSSLKSNSAACERAGSIFDAMPALAAIREEFAQAQPLAGRSVLLHLHLTKETAALGTTLITGGAQVTYLPSNRNPSAPDVVEFVKAQGSIVLCDASKLNDLIQATPQPGYVVVEGSGRIFQGIHSEDGNQAFFRSIQGISEHTSGGGQIVDTYDPSTLRVPVVAVYRDALKGDLETGLGTSQTVVAALMRCLQAPLAGKRAVIVGFGHVGQGLATMMQTLGTRITVVETNPEACLLAHLKGFRLARLGAAINQADFCITTTGKPRVLGLSALEKAREGLVLANVSDKPNEIDVTDCRFEGKTDEFISTWTTPGGARFRLLAGGLQINHVFDKGNPAELMDLSFSLHAFVVCWLAEEKRPSGLYPIPPHIRAKVITLFLAKRV